MKKLAICIGFMFLLLGFLRGSSVSAAEENLLVGKWLCELPQGSIIYIFKPDGQGLLYAVDLSTKVKVTIRFFYVIDTRVTASSSIDSFREYLIKVWFPDQNLVGTMRVYWKDDGVLEISEIDGTRKLELRR